MMGKWVIKIANKGDKKKKEKEKREKKEIRKKSKSLLYNLKMMDIK